MRNVYSVLSVPKYLKKKFIKLFQKCMVQYSINLTLFFFNKNISSRFYVHNLGALEMEPLVAFFKLEKTKIKTTYLLKNPLSNSIYNGYTIP